MFLASHSLTRHVELDIDIGADARDWSAVQAAEKLKPVDTELRRIEENINEIVHEMEYLRQREQKLRDTNESTNERVKWFSIGSLGMLVSLGAWQLVYLRSYFRWVIRVSVKTRQLTRVTDRNTSSRRRDQLSHRSGRLLLHDLQLDCIVPAVC